MSPAFLLRLRMALLWVMLGAMVLSVGIITLWIIAGDPFAEVWLIGILLLGGFSFTSLLCVNMLCRSRFAVLMWVGVASSVLAFIAWQPVAMIVWWRLRISQEGLILAGTFFTVLAAWCAIFAALKSHTWVNTLSRVVTHITLGIAAFIGLLAMIAVIDDPGDDSFYAVLGVSSLLGGCGLLSSMALALMSRVRTQGPGETLSGKVVVDLICPRCKTAQAIRSGLSRCTNCGLRIEITVEEPVCVCGYQLYQLTGEKCPECGREIPEADRWAGAEYATSGGAAFEDIPPIN